MEQLITCKHTAREGSPHNVLHSSSSTTCITTSFFTCTCMLCWFVHCKSFVHTGSLHSSTCQCWEGTHWSSSNANTMAKCWCEFSWWGIVVIQWVWSVPRKYNHSASTCVWPRSRWLYVRNCVSKMLLNMCLSCLSSNIFNCIFLRLLSKIYIHMSARTTQGLMLQIVNYFCNIWEPKFSGIS